MLHVRARARPCGSSVGRLLCACVSVPAGFPPFSSLSLCLSLSLLLLAHFATPCRTGTPNKPPFELPFSIHPSDVPSINHNIRINIPRTSFALRSAPSPLHPPRWMTRPTHQHCKNFPIERGWRFARSKQTRTGKGMGWRGRRLRGGEKSNWSRDKTRESFNTGDLLLPGSFPFCGREARGC